ncbi:MAG: AAA family ATPase, partial [Spirochaetales bacterium]|nr:AAA family ATPase [Spirochaetales bacterium]
MAKYVHRWIESQVSQYLSFMRIVHIRGARQCGKTTLVRQQVKADVLYRTLDDPTTLNSAKQDPVHFLRHQSSTMI